MPDPAFCWATYGETAFGIFGPGGQQIAIVGLPAEKRLTYLRTECRQPHVVAWHPLATAPEPKDASA